MASFPMQITETNEAGNVVATYVQSSAQEGSRVDTILPKESKSTWQRTLDVFLPAGYPHSVTEDYLNYQIYDSLQAFSSSIAGLLSSRAVLQGVGVGDASASPTAALLLSILQESTGRIATILFAHRLGKSLEPECKMYRLLADIFNDIAFVLDVLSPTFPRPLRVVVLSSSSVLRALCGVAAGSSKASLSAHFARWGNLGELNAKDSSQETVISLLGMLVGSVVVSWVTTPWATWTTLILLLSIHLRMNHLAVRAVAMRTLNRQRANIVLSQYLSNGEVLTPTQVSEKESIFEVGSELRESHGRVIGHCEIGTPMTELLRSVGKVKDETTGAIVLPDGVLEHLLHLYKDQNYIMWPEHETQTARVVLKRDCSTAHQVKAWFHALLTMYLFSGLSISARDGIGKDAERRRQASVKGKPGQFETVQLAAGLTNKYFGQLATRLRTAGWDLETAALETHSGTRVSFAADRPGMSAQSA